MGTDYRSRAIQMIRGLRSYKKFSDQISTEIENRMRIFLIFSILIYSQSSFGYRIIHVNRLSILSLFNEWNLRKHHADRSYVFSFL